MVNHEDSDAIPPMARPYKIDVDAGPHYTAPQAPPPTQNVPASPPTPATWTIIGINVAIFAAMVAVSGGQAFNDPTEQMLYRWGANYGPATLTGDYWRVVSSMFLHAGIIHIGMNMYVLSDIGRGVERLYGTSKFIVIYMLAGIGGSVVSLFFNPTVPSVGASGAVFGAFGAFLAILRGHAASFDKARSAAIVRSVLFLLVFNLIWGLSRPGIDNAAHIGGFFSGVLAGSAVMPALVNEKRWTSQNVAWAIFLALMIGGAGYADYLAFVGGSH